MRRAIQLLLSVIAGSAAAFFAVGFLTNFYTSQFSLVALSLLISALGQFTAHLLLTEIFASAAQKWRTEVVGLLVLLLSGGLALAAIRLCLLFPTLFDRRLFFLGAASVPTFAASTLASAAAVTVLLAVMENRGLLNRIRTSRAFASLRGQLPGLLLASIFFLVYFSLAETINFPGHRTLDQYFDADISAWLGRFQAASARDITDVVRAVHPAVLLFLRPIIWLVSLLLNGDRLHAIFLVHALAASACIFLVWRIVKRASSNASYALLAASLLGASASHLLFGAMLETYIYSALALLLFVHILQNDMVSFKSAVLAGIFVFGITVTNLAQTVILYFSKEPKFKTLFRYGVIVLGVVFVLNWIQAWIYPAAQTITPANLLAEQGYRVDFSEKPWQLTGRVFLTARALLLYGVVAPKPFVLMEELGVNVPNFRTFQITIGIFHAAGYRGLADAVAKGWLVLLAVALLLFVLDWFKNPKPFFSLALLACLGLNFALHLLYGDDPLLYSLDWVYALLLFVMFSFMRFADRKWMQLILAVFLALAMTINLGLIRQIMEASAPFYGR